MRLLAAVNHPTQAKGGGQRSRPPSPTVVPLCCILSPAALLQVASKERGGGGGGGPCWFSASCPECPCFSKQQKLINVFAFIAGEQEAVPAVQHHHLARRPEARLPLKSTHSPHPHPHLPLRPVNPFVRSSRISAPLPCVFFFL